MKKFFLLILFLLPLTVQAASLRGTSLGEISGCDYYAIEDNYGDYTIAEWYGGITPYAGDVVAGDLHSYGFKDIYNITRDRSSRAWLDDWLLSEERAMEKLVDKCGWSRELVDYFENDSSYYSPPAPPSRTYRAPVISCPTNSSFNDGVCQCNTGYVPAKGACETPASACVINHGSNTRMMETWVGMAKSYECVCENGFIEGGDGMCIDNRPVRTISQKSYQWALTGKNCRTNTSLSETEINDCVVYEANSEGINWKIAEKPSTELTIPAKVETASTLPPVIPDFKVNNVITFSQEGLKKQKNTGKELASTSPLSPSPVAPIAKLQLSSYQEKSLLKRFLDWFK